MESLFKVAFQDFEPNDMQKTAVDKHVAKFEEKFGRIIAGRIVVKGPGERHRTGGLYEINIRLNLPDDKEVDVGRTPAADERHSDFYFALNDAFKRARRQLQDKVRRLQGKIKLHELQPSGIVTKLFEDHGFLEDSNGIEIYFHANSVLNAGFARLQPGTPVTYVEEQGEKGPQASTVRLAAKRRS